MLEKIISGGQTGADQGALDAAIRLGIDHGGWIPKGRKTEAGPLPDRYRLQEMPTDNYRSRTEKNVVSAEATLIFSHGPLTGGALVTQQAALQYGRPWRHLDLETVTAFDASRKVNDWIREFNIRVLNVAGPRASQDPRIYQATMDILESAFYLNLVRMPGGETDQKIAVAPDSIAQAVDMLVARLPLRDRSAIANMRGNQLDNLFQALETYLEDAFSLGKGNDLLMAACTHYLDEMLPDESKPAMAIITELWKSLKTTHRLRLVK